MMLLPWLLGGVFFVVVVLGVMAYFKKTPY